MELGAFSVSLVVKYIPASKQFYKNIRFTVSRGGMGKIFL